MRRVLLLVCVPLLTGLLAGAAVAWWVEPRPRAMVEHTAQQFPLDMSKDGSIACFRDSTEPAHPGFFFADTNSGSILSTYQPPADVYGYQFTQDGRLFLSAVPRTANAELRLESFDPKTTVSTELLRERVGIVWTFPVSADGTTAAALIERTNQILVWDLATGQKGPTIQLDTRHKPCLALSSDGRCLIIFEQFQTDTSDRKDPFAVLLFDTSTGQLCDRLEFPASSYGFVHFVRYGNVAAILGMPFKLHAPTKEGANWTAEQTPPAQYVYSFANVGRAKSLHAGRNALQADQRGTAFLVSSPIRDVFQIESANGEALSPPLPLSNSEFHSIPHFSPDSSHLILHSERIVVYPKLARDLAGRLGLPWFASALHKEAALLNWKTGRRKVLSSYPMQFPTGTGPFFGHPFLQFSADSNVLALTYERAGTFRTEFWNFPLPTRPYWLITLLATLAVAASWCALVRFTMRRRR